MTKKVKKKAVNLKKESLKIFEESAEDFEKLFGRKQTKHDPVFLDQIFYTASELHQSIINELSETYALEPAYIYAFDKLGYFVTDNNINEWSDKEILDWEAAIEEAQRIINGEIKFEENLLEKNITKISDNIYQLISIFSLLNWKINFQKKDVDLIKKINIHDYSIFCLKKTLSSIKACKKLIENNFIGDSLIIIRSLFEIYLQLSFANNEAETLLREQFYKIGIHNQTHKRIKNKIVEIKSGQEIQPLNNKEKSSLNKLFQNEDSHLYYLIYEDFSTLTHPDLKSAHFYFTDDHDIHYRSNFDQIANFYCSVVCVMILFELFKLNLFEEPFQNDIKHNIILIGNTILEYFDLTREENYEDLKYVELRIKKTIKEIKKIKTTANKV